MSLVGELNDALQQLVVRFKVCWDVFPHEEMVDGTRIQTGFDIELYGTHAVRAEVVSPGCPDCLVVYDALQVIALWVLAAEHDECRLELSRYEQAIRYSHLRHDRPDVLFTITVVHSSACLENADVCEVQCLDRIKKRLQALGTERRMWNPSRHQGPQRHKLHQ